MCKRQNRGTYMNVSALDNNAQPCVSRFVFVRDHFLC